LNQSIESSVKLSGISGTSAQPTELKTQPTESFSTNNFIIRTNKSTNRISKTTNRNNNSISSLFIEERRKKKDKSEGY
jgi:hypothetical protein